MFKISLLAIILFLTVDVKSQDFSCSFDIDKENCALYLSNGDSFGNDKEWHIIRGWDYYQRDWVITPKITFYSSQEYSFPGTNKIPMFTSNDCESLAFNNFNGETDPTIFEIISLSEYRLVLFNEDFCPDTCLLVTPPVRNIYEDLLCNVEYCDSDFGECDKGICFCQFGEIGRFCKGSYTTFEDINSNTYRQAWNSFLIYNDEKIKRVDEDGNVVWSADPQSNGNVLKYMQISSENTMSGYNDGNLYTLDSLGLLEIFTIENGNRELIDISSDGGAIFSSTDTLYKVDISTGNISWNIEHNGSVHRIANDRYLSMSSDHIEIINSNGIKEIEKPNTLDLVVNPNVNELMLFDNGFFIIYQLNLSAFQIEQYDLDANLNYSKSFRLNRSSFPIYNLFSFEDQFGIHSYMNNDINDDFICVFDNSGELDFVHYFNNVQVGDYSLRSAFKSDLNEFIFLTYNSIYKYPRSAFYNRIPLCPENIILQNSSDENIADLEINLFPNPSINSISISNLSQEASIDIFSIDGLKMKISSLNGHFDISTLPEGIYFVRVYDQRKRKQSLLRFVKM